MLWLDQLWAVFWPKSVGVSGGAVGWKPSTVSTADGLDILHQLMVNISHCLQGIQVFIDVRVLGDGISSTKGMSGWVSMTPPEVVL